MMNFLRESLVAQRAYGFGVQVLDGFFGYGILDRIRLDIPVVSVGNLTLGGTGKTPFVQFLLGRYLEMGFRVGIVSLNYKAEAGNQFPQKVDLQYPQAGRAYGDEPALLARKFPTVPVVVGPKKWESAVYLRRHFDVDLILIDDGFQHRSLYRDLDFVLLDASAPLEELELLPKGRARESTEALKRADCVVLTKVNQADELWLEHLLALVPEGVPVLQMNSQLQGDFLEKVGQKILAFAGIGNPDSFRKSLQEEAFFELLDFVPFPDHHPYTAADIEMLIRKAQEVGAEAILTTEKDMIKIETMVSQHPQFQVLPLAFQPVEGQEDFQKFLLETAKDWPRKGSQRLVP